MKKLTYYLWTDDELRTPTKDVYYLSDYLEQKDGKTWIDGHGWRKCTLVKQSLNKMELIKYVK